MFAVKTCKRASLLRVTPRTMFFRNFSGGGGSGRELSPEIAAMPEPGLFTPLKDLTRQLFAGYSPPNPATSRGLSRIDAQVIARIQRDGDSLKELAMTGQLPHMKKYPCIEEFWYASWLPVKTVQGIMEWMLLSTSMPLWAIVFTLPFIFRATLSLPYTVRVTKQYEKILPKIPAAMKEFNSLAVRCGRDAATFNRESHEVRSRYGFNPYFSNWMPFKPALLQLPIHLTMYVACKTIFPRLEEAKTGGIDFFSDLTEVNTTYVFPATVLFGAMVCAQKMAAKAQARPSKGRKQAAVFGGIGGGILLYASMHATHALNLYIVGNMASYLFVATAMESNRIRNAFGLREREYTKQFQHQMMDTIEEAKTWTSATKDPRAADKWAAARMHVFADTPSESGMQYEDIEHDAPVKPGEVASERLSEDREVYRENKAKWMQEQGIEEAHVSNAFFENINGVLHRVPTAKAPSKVTMADGTEVIVMQNASALPKEERKRRIREFEYDFEAAAAASEEQWKLQKEREKARGTDEAADDEAQVQFTFLSDTESAKKPEESGKKYRDLLIERQKHKKDSEKKVAKIYSSE